MALNDVVDARFDRANASGRPVAAGRISTGAAGTASVVLLTLGFGAVLLGRAAAAPISAMAVLTAAVVLYNLMHRRSAIAAMALMAICRGCVPVVAALLMASAISPAVWIASAAVACWTIGVTTLGRGERGGERLWTGGLIWLVVAALFVVPMTFGSSTGRWDAAAGGLLIVLGAWIPAVARFRRQGRLVDSVCWAIAGFGVLDGALLLASGHEGWAATCVVLGAATLGAQLVGRGS